MIKVYLVQLVILAILVPLVYLEVRRERKESLEKQANAANRGKMATRVLLDSLVVKETQAAQVCQVGMVTGGTKVTVDTLDLRAW